MKSKFSKIFSILMPVAFAVTGSSCKLGKSISDEWEIQTEVPSSLDQGKPSAAPTNQLADAVPADSNLVQLADADGMTTATQVGHSSLTGLPTDQAGGVVDIPMPEFGAGSQPPVEILSVPPPSMAITNSSLSELDLPSSTARIVTTEVDPLVPPVTEADLAAAPKATSASDPTLSVEGNQDAVPMLHGALPISEFYQQIHNLVSADFAQDAAAKPVTPPVPGSPAAPVNR